MKKIISILLLIVLMFSLSGCNNVKNNSSEVNTNKSKLNKTYEKHNNKNYYEMEEIYNKYLHIKNKLKKPNKLTDKDVIDLCNVYKKIYSTIDYIDCLRNDVYTKADDSYIYAIDELPDMDGLYVEMMDKLIKLVVERNLLRFPKNSDDFQKEFITEECLRSTDYFTFEQLIIVRNINTPRLYYILSTDSTCFFEISIYTEGDKTTMISPTPSIENTNELSEKGISLLYGSEEIPSVNVISKALEDAEDLAD